MTECKISKAHVRFGYVYNNKTKHSHLKRKIMECLKEIQPFLSIDTPQHLKAIAVTNVLSLTGSDEGRCLLLKCCEIITALGNLAEDTDPTVEKDSLLCLVNLSAGDDGAEILLKSIPNLVDKCLKNIIDENCALADAWSMVLSNISRPNHLAEQVFNALENKILDLINAFTRTDYNKKKCHLNYLGPIFSNLSQVSKGREFFCRPTSEFLYRLTPFIQFDASIVRKGGIVGLLKNICFDTSRHSYLLDEINILPIILLSLAGPEEYTDDENDKFPMELQYLGSDKQRENDPDIRKMLLDSLNQLCATRKAREFLRSKGTYEILRELHKWEASDAGDKLCLLACENVVDILIRTEDEIGEDDLKTMDVPNDLVDKFNKMDANLIEQ